jgi:gamma-glutamyltranspeptidase/glutathione hydrolase
MGGYLRSGPQIPGERPRTAIAPVFVTKKNKIVLALGAAGGIRIPSAIVQTISRFIDQGKTLSEAIAAPRIHPKQRIDENNRRVIDLLAFEAETSAPGWSQADVNYWRTQGFNVTEVDKHASFGRVHAITKQNNVLKGTADPDWEGSASDQMICGGVAN